MVSHWAVVRDEVVVYGEIVALVKRFCFGLKLVLLNVSGFAFKDIFGVLYAVHAWSRQQAGQHAHENVVKKLKHVYFFQENKGSKQELFIVVYINQLFKGAPLSLL